MENVIPQSVPITEKGAIQESRPIGECQNSSLINDNVFL